MAFYDYTNEVKVEEDTHEMYRWCAQNIPIGQWGMKMGFTGKRATYCFQYEKDAIMFMLRWV